MNTLHPIMAQALAPFEPRPTIEEALKRIRELEQQVKDQREVIRLLNKDLESICPSDYATILDGQTEETVIHQDILLDSIKELHRDVDVALKLEAIAARRYLAWVEHMNNEAVISARGEY
jgi:hypothetical protein